MNLMELRGVSVIFEDRSGGFFKRRRFYALNNVSLNIGEDDLILVLGESGAGKTTLGRVIVGLQKPTKGSVIYKGYDVWKQKHKIFSTYRREVQLVPQDPYSTLPYNKTVKEILEAPLKRWNKLSKQELEKRLVELLDMVRLSPPEDFLDKYPHQLSGGQRQRLNIARSLSVDPKLVVADEPVTMVDASLRLGLLNTLAEIKNKLHLSMVFITHDIPTARYFYHLVKRGNTIVIFGGKVVEEGDLEELLSNPYHPYTKDLIDITPSIDNLYKEKPEVKINYERVDFGCPYQLRCPYVMDICKKEEPQLIGTNSHRVACYLYGGQNR